MKVLGGGDKKQHTRGYRTSFFAKGHLSPLVFFNDFFVVFFKVML